MAAFTQFGLEPFRQAIAWELRDLGLAPPVIAHHQTVALHCYESVPMMECQSVTAPAHAVPTFHAPVYASRSRDMARVNASGNSVLRETGGWWTFRPLPMADKYNGCWLRRLSADSRPDRNACGICHAPVRDGSPAAGDVSTGLP